MIEKEQITTFRDNKLDTLKVCMLAPEFFPVWGGVGSYIIELVKSLPRDVDIHVLTLKRKISGINYNENSALLDSIIGRPIHVHYLSASQENFFYNIPFQLACLAQIPELHRKYRFDVIHSHLCHMPDVFFRLLFRRLPPTILTLHGTIQSLRDHAITARQTLGELESGEESIIKFYPLIHLLQQAYVKKVARFIAVSEATKRLALNELKVTEEKIDLIYNGVDTKIFPYPSEEDFENKFRKPTILYMGRLVSKKGIHVLIKSMPSVLRAFPEAKFLFAGGGDIPLYGKIIRDMGVPENNFSFLGHFGYYDRPKIIREATVFVNPSFFENCSLAILEAMSSGSAIVASCAGGNPELIKSGKNGLLVPPLDHDSLANSIVSILQNENLNKMLGREARRVTEDRFSSIMFGKKTYESYLRLLNNPF